ncbi:MAG: nitroreductase family protein [Gammaproteobacteria bacterium]|nr:nitroreductase family protein [Gammaproteobacteria bacterium]
MDTKTAIETRRAIKHFDPTHRMTEYEIRELLSLAILSPTAFNIQNWRFVVVRDPGIRAALRAVSWMQPQITEASLLVVICADIHAWQKNPERYWRHAPEDVRARVLEAINTYYSGRPQVQRDEAMRSCGLAAQTLMLAARHFGYDSCPMDLADFDDAGRLINLPEDHVIGLFVAIGKGLREPWPRAGQLSLDDVIINDCFVADGA